MQNATNNNSNSSVRFNNPYGLMFVSVVKIALVLIIVIFAFIVYRKIKKSLEYDSREEIKQLPYIDRGFYKEYINDYYENPSKYTAKQREQFLKNYEYADSFFSNVGKDIKELSGFVWQGIWNPYQMAKTSMGMFSSSGFRQIYGGYMLSGLSDIKSQIMLSMMAERFFIQTGYELVDFFNKFYDADTMKEFYKYVKNLPLSVK